MRMRTIIKTLMKMRKKLIMIELRMKRVTDWTMAFILKIILNVLIQTRRDVRMMVRMKRSKGR